MWIQWIAIIGVLIVVSFGIAVLYSNYHWQLNTDILRAELING
jgi:hypothetical protein